MTANPVPLVLVFEPDKIQRDLIQLCLSRIGCDILLVRSVEQVIPMLSKNYPSMFILDTFIPGTSGLELLSELNHKKALKHTIVLVVSSFGFPEIIQQAKDLGVNEFLMKPLDTEEFTNRVKSLLKI